MGSISKIVTAIAVLQQVQREEIALSDPVADHVDFLADAPGAPVTVEELLTHSSGMPSDDIALRDTVVSVRDPQLHVDGAAHLREPPRRWPSDKLGLGESGAVTVRVKPGHPR